MVNTYVGTITDHTDAVTNANGEITSKESVTITASNTKPYNSGVNTCTFETTAFTDADATAKTVVLYTVAHNGSAYDVKSAVAATAVENVAVTSYSAGRSVTAGGTQYSYSAKADASSTYTMTGGATYTLYLDSYGYVIDDAEYNAAGANNYSLVLDIGDTNPTTEFGSTYDTNIQVVDMTGTVSVIKVRTTTNSFSGCDEGDIITYTEDTRNEGCVNVEVKADESTGVAMSDAEINRTKPVIATGITANAGTVFVLKTNDAPVTWTVYTGIASLPTYTGINGVDAYYVNGTDGYADVVFLDVSNATAGTSVADELVYILNADPVSTNYDAANNVTYFAYSAIVNGVVTEIYSLNDNDDDSLIASAGLAKVTQYDSYGYVNTISAVAEDGVYVDVNNSFSGEATYSEPTLRLGGDTYVTSASTVVYYYNTTTRTLEVGTPADLVGTLSGALYVIQTSTNDTTVATIYFVGTIA